MTLKTALIEKGRPQFIVLSYDVRKVARKAYKKLVKFLKSKGAIRMQYSTWFVPWSEGLDKEFQELNRLYGTKMDLLISRPRFSDEEYEEKSTKYEKEYLADWKEIKILIRFIRDCYLYPDQAVDNKGNKITYKRMHDKAKYAEHLIEGFTKGLLSRKKYELDNWKMTEGKEKKLADLEFELEKERKMLSDYKIAIKNAMKGQKTLIKKPEEEKGKVEEKK